MKLSVIVCAKDAGSIIPGCLESIKHNKPSEIILIHSNKKMKKPVLIDRMFYDNRRGLSFARRLGARKAKESLISFTDSDTIIPENCYKNMIKEMKDNDWVGIHAQIVAPEVSNYLEWAEDVHFRALFNNPGSRHRIGTIVTVWDKSKVLEFGFDPFMKRTSEDQDLCIRLVNEGFVVGVSSVKAFHRHRANLKSFILQKFQYGRGNARIAWKHKSLKHLLAWFLSVPYGFLGVWKKFGLKKAFCMVPYYLLNSVSVGLGVFYQLPLLFFEVLA